MTTNYHTPFIDGITKYRPSNHNAPLSELDTQITQNVSDIGDLETDINQAGLSAGAGKTVLVNPGGSALEFVDPVFHYGEPVLHLDDFVYR